MHVYAQRPAFYAILYIYIYIHIFTVLNICIHTPYTCTWIVGSELNRTRTKATECYSEPVMSRGSESVSRQFQSEAGQWSVSEQGHSPRPSLSLSLSFSLFSPPVLRGLRLFLFSSLRFPSPRYHRLGSIRLEILLKSMYPGLPVSPRVLTRYTYTVIHSATVWSCYQWGKSKN